MANTPELNWAGALTIAGASLVLLVGLFGAALLYGLGTQASLRDFYLEQVDPYAGPVTTGIAGLAVLVALWTLVTGGVALAAGIALLRERHVMPWGVVGIVAGVASFPVTGGMGIGALLIVVGSGVALLALGLRPAQPHPT